MAATALGPIQQTAWNIDLVERLFAPPRKLRSYDISDSDFEASIDPKSHQIAQMEKWCFEISDECLAARGMQVDETGRRILAVAVAAALQRASLTLAGLAKGNPAPSTFFSPVAAATQPYALPPQAVTFKQLVDGWAAERQPVAKTQYEWSRVVRQLEAFWATLMQGD